MGCLLPEQFQQQPITVLLPLPHYSHSGRCPCGLVQELSPCHVWMKSCLSDSSKALSYVEFTAL